MKRFYEKVSMKAIPGGYGVFLDGKPIKTPSKMAFVVPNPDLCELICAEWEEQSDKIRPDTMPLTQLLHTKIEKVFSGRKDMEAEILKYVNGDLLTYRAYDPEEIVKRQNQLWQPWIEWFQKNYGHEFKTTTALGALKQDKAIHEIIAQEITRMDDDRFTLMQMVTPACGSIILSLALMTGAIEAEQLISCAYLEEDYKFDLYNEELHGGDPLTEKKRKALRRDLEAAQDYLDTLS